jgi:histidinol-phosphatase
MAYPMIQDVSEDLQFALSLADLADSVSLPRFQAADLQITTKPDRTFVTDADTAVENALRERIATERPSESFYGEETGQSEGSSRGWIIDPIDGTSNFLRGVPNWATLICLASENEPVIGVVSMPALQTRWWAELGHGAWKQRAGKPAVQIHASGVSQLEHASLSFQSIAQWEDAGCLAELLTLRRSVWRDRAYGDAWSYMALAEGLLDIVGEFDVKAYDLAAHMPIVREAGGTMTDIKGNSTVWNGSALATNGLVHRDVISVLHTARQHKPVAE